MSTAIPARPSPMGALLEVAPLEGLEEIEIDGTLVRGVQHLRRLGIARR